MGEKVHARDFSKQSFDCGHNEWQIEDALRCLCRAKEIQADPKMMGKVKELARKKIKEMETLSKAA